MIKNLAKLILHNVNKDYGQQKLYQYSSRLSVMEDGR